MSENDEILAAIFAMKSDIGYIKGKADSIEEQTKKTKMVMIHALSIDKVEGDQVTFTATVSSGTYIRQLSYDLFKTLGIESYLETLTRTRIGDFTLEKCILIEDMAGQLAQLSRDE